MPKLNFLPSLFFIGLFSFLGLLLTPNSVLAQWRDPIGLPGETTGFRIVVNPLTENLDLNNYFLGDSKNLDFVLEPGGSKGLSIAGNPWAGWFIGNVKITGNLEVGSLNGGTLDTFWKRSDPTNPSNLNIYYTAGNVGIGSPWPEQLLSLKKLSGNNPEISLDAKGGTNQHWGIYHDRTTDQLRIWHDNKNKIVVTHEGRVGIYTESPTYRLDVVKNSADDYAAQFWGGLRLSNVDMDGNGNIDPTEYGLLKLAYTYGQPPAAACNNTTTGTLNKAAMLFDYEQAKLWVCTCRTSACTGGPVWLSITFN